MAAPNALEKEQIFGLAEKEMEYRVDMFNKLTGSCFNKCMENTYPSGSTSASQSGGLRYKESELNSSETHCIDRCVSKYWQVTSLVGQLLGNNRPPT